MRSKLFLASAALLAGLVAASAAAQLPAVQVAQAPGVSDGPGKAPSKPRMVTGGKYAGPAARPKSQRGFQRRPSAAEKPLWWWTNPTCRPNLRKYGNCLRNRHDSADYDRGP